MIVDPDFPDHWKTRMLVDSLDGDEAAPVYLLRLWGHCQLRRAWIFSPLPAAGLKALCHYPGCSSKLESALVAAGFITRSEEILTVCGWDEYNSGIIANWTNGKLGGRPRKHPAATPKKTHGLAMANPSPTHGEPIGEDRNGEDRKSLFSEPENKPASTPKKSEKEANSQAESIYGAYPRKVKKPEALKAIRKAMRKHPPEFLLERVRAYAAAIAWQERQFIPHPETWFNAEQFDDDPEDWKPPSHNGHAPSRKRELKGDDLSL